MIVELGAVIGIMWSLFGFTKVTQTLVILKLAERAYFMRRRTFKLSDGRTVKAKIFEFVGDDNEPAIGFIIEDLGGKPVMMTEQESRLDKISLRAREELNAIKILRERYREWGVDMREYDEFMIHKMEKLLETLLQGVLERIHEITKTPSRRVTIVE